MKAHWCAGKVGGTIRRKFGDNLGNVLAWTLIAISAVKSTKYIIQEVGGY